MKNNKITLVACGMFLAGCAVSQIPELLVPALHAGQSNVQKWEYQCSDLSAGFGNIDADEVNKKIKPFGSEGWELTTSSFQRNGDLIFCFKRPF